MSEEYQPRYEAPQGGFKKRRLQNACDLCRQKKVRCDSANMPGNRCSNCIAFGSECTHVLANAKKRGAPKPSIQPPGASHSPEASPSSCHNAGHTRKDFSHPGQELTSTVLSASYSLPSDPVLAQQTLFELASYARSLEQRLSAIARQSPPSTSKANLSPPTVTSALAAAPLQEAYSPPSDTEDEAIVDIALSDPLRRFSMGDRKRVFYGKSSDMVFIKSALDIKNDYVGNKSQIQSAKRPEFWNVYPWQEIPKLPSPPLTFPSPTLAQLLVKHYFEDYNVHFPLLHRPTFERKFRDNLHLRDTQFGLLLLSVCAIGSRFIDINDPRVLGESVLEEEDGTGKQHSLGWKWYRQIGARAMRSEFPGRPDVSELQVICNCIMFAQATSAPEMCWILLGHGVRYALECGVHRRHFGGPKLSVEKEQWKRAFWILVCIDLFMSSFLGRPRATNPVDYDLDLPCPVDDEYWEHPDPEMAFKQPPGVPSKVAFWVQFVKLLDIFGFAQRTIYAVRKPETPSPDTGGGTSFDQKAVAELDQALNDWIDNIPYHLRWNPHMYQDNPIFFGQAIAMYAAYYWVQIQIHRPFMRLRDKGNRTMAYSSLAVCANAARSCAHVMSSMTQGEEGVPPFPSTQASVWLMALFNSAIVLLLNIWGGKRLGITSDPARELGDVYKCLNVLRAYEKRWQITGRLCDIITELISVSDIDAAPSISQSLKRPHPTDEPTHEAPVESETQAIATASTAQNYDTPTFMNPPPVPEGEDSTMGWSYGLPLHTKDLSRLPIHGSTYDIFGGEQMSTDSQPMMSEADLSQIFSRRNDYGHFELDSGHSPASTQLDTGTLDLWSDTPGGDRWEDWGPYVASIDELLRSAPPT
ncbi:hypothetical protein WG66_011647 [Moniliophthora roreri]|nr:hypothetical protein WG66_011647 [Moniliophthora roreri]